MAPPPSPQSAQSVGVDLDPARRPGVPRERPPSAWPNTRYPPDRQQTAPSVPAHGRPHQPMPPVYGTAVPLRGLSGLIRQAAYRYPDHQVRHWTMLLFADRVDVWGTRTRRFLSIAAPVAALAFLGRWALAGGRR